MQKLNQLGIPGVVFKAETVWKCGIMGTHMSVIIDGQEEEINNYEHHCSHTHNSSGEHKHDSKMVIFISTIICRIFVIL